MIRSSSISPEASNGSCVWGQDARTDAHNGQERMNQMHVAQATQLHDFEVTRRVFWGDGMCWIMFGASEAHRKGVFEMQSEDGTLRRVLHLLRRHARAVGEHLHEILDVAPGDRGYRRARWPCLDEDVGVAEAAREDVIREQKLSHAQGARIWPRRHLRLPLALGVARDEEGDDLLPERRRRRWRRWRWRRGRRRRRGRWW